MVHGTDRNVIFYYGRMEKLASFNEDKKKKVKTNYIIIRLFFFGKLIYAVTYSDHFCHISFHTYGYDSPYDCNSN